MNSRLNLNLREKYGLVYSIDAGYTPYLDTGFLGIYFGTDPKKVDKAQSLIVKELKRLRDVPLTTLQIHQTKEQLIGQLAMAEESNNSFMLMMAKSLLDINRVESLPDLFSQIRAVTPEQLQTLAQESFDETQFSSLTFVPEK